MEVGANSEFWPPERFDLRRQRQGRVLKPAWGKYVFSVVAARANGARTSVRRKVAVAKEP